MGVNLWEGLCHINCVSIFIHILLEYCLTLILKLLNTFLRYSMMSGVALSFDRAKAGVHALPKKDRPVPCQFGMVPAQFQPLSSDQCAVACMSLTKLHVTTGPCRQVGNSQLQRITSNCEDLGHSVSQGRYLFLRVSAPLAMSRFRREKRTANTGVAFVG